jgi:hypothetical protein
MPAPWMSISQDMILCMAAKLHACILIVVHSKAALNPYVAFLKT